jgi:transcriptional regulator with XRE-family HTH domain
MDTADKKALGARIAEAREAKGIRRQAQLARMLNPPVTRSSVAQWESGYTEPSARNLRQLSEILGVSLEWLGLASSAAGRSVTPEGELVDLKSLPTASARLLSAAMTSKKSEVWLLNSDAMGALYHPGDYLIVEVGARPQIRDIVLAEVDKIPVFRMYLAPYLFSLPAGGQPAKSILIDSNRVILRGVVTRALKL